MVFAFCCKTNVPFIAIDSSVLLHKVNLLLSLWPFKQHCVMAMILLCVAVCNPSADTGVFVGYNLLQLKFIILSEALGGFWRSLCRCLPYKQRNLDGCGHVLITDHMTILMECPRTSCNNVCCFASLHLSKGASSTCCVVLNGCYEENHSA